MDKDICTATIQTNNNKKHTLKVHQEIETNHWDISTHFEPEIRIGENHMPAFYSWGTAANEK